MNTFNVRSDRNDPKADEELRALTESDPIFVAAESDDGRTFAIACTPVAASILRVTGCAERSTTPRELLRATKLARLAHKTIESMGKVIDAIFEDNGSTTAPSGNVDELCLNDLLFVVGIAHGVATDAIKSACDVGVYACDAQQSVNAQTAGITVAKLALNFNPKNSADTFSVRDASEARAVAGAMLDMRNGKAAKA